MDHALMRSIQVCFRCFSHSAGLRYVTQGLTNYIIPASSSPIRRVCHNFIQSASIVRLSEKSNAWRAQQIAVRRFATEPSNPRKSENIGKVDIPLWGRLLLVFCVGGAVYYIYESTQYEKELESENYRYQEFEKIQLGGDWTLTDHFGNKRSSTDFRGQWILMYMGFTHCPDICPEEMEKLGKIVTSFDKDPKLPNLQPIFITLDPERDSPAVIKDYLSEFTSPRIVGFTGSEDEIREVAKKFRAYFGKGPKDVDNDYIVDHTIIVYLINPKGEFVNYYGRSMTAEQIIHSATKHIQNYHDLEKHRQKN